ncbi:MAG: hypothetical protein KUG77_01565 [Nannocystaceae bacterium]|nr:hypothetical protein [Nannocystaceae bacterium]
MPRTNQTAPPANPPPDLVLGEEMIAPEHGEVHHVARNADQANHVAELIETYGYLTSMEGERDGPWTLDFECVLVPWLHEALQALEHDFGRLRHLLRGATFADAWDHFGPADRVVLRRIRSRYNQYFDEHPPDNVLFDLVLDEDDWRGRYGIESRPVSGGWYQLSFSAAMAPDAAVTAPLLMQPAGSSAFEEYGPFTLSRVRELPPYFLDVEPPVAESVLHALNSGDDKV